MPKIKINQHIKFDEDGEPVDQDNIGDKFPENNDNYFYISAQNLTMNEFYNQYPLMKV